MNYYNAGDHCVLRGIVYKKVWIVQSMIVVEDNENRTALLLLPGSQCAIPQEYREWGNSGKKDRIKRWQLSKKSPLSLEEHIWQRNRILFFLEPSKYYAICLFWQHESNKFNCYYINYQLPYTRTKLGFDTLDLDLDIVINEKYEWKWKDIDDYQTGIMEGAIKEEWVRGIEQSKEEVFLKINNHTDPMDGSWINWIPDPNWMLPKLPPDWQKP
jgi:protein associated with RNAse G/E